MSFICVMLTAEEILHFNILLEQSVSMCEKVNVKCDFNVDVLTQGVAAMNDAAENGNNTSRCIIANPPQQEEKLTVREFIDATFGIKESDKKQHDLNCDELVKLRYPQSFVERSESDEGLKSALERSFDDPSLVPPLKVKRP